MGGYLAEPDLTEEELAILDAMVASGRFPSRAAAVLELLRRGLEADRDKPRD